MSKIADALRKIQEDRAGSDVSHGHRKIARIETNSHNALDETVVLPSKEQDLSRVVQIDRDAMREAGLIAPEAENKLFEDEYRVIKRPILANAFGQGAQSIENGHIVLVTSAVSGDGKTFTCINLALSMAREQDTSVLLIDADIPKPHISSLFDVQDEPGLTDYLGGQISSPDEVILQTSTPGLAIMPAGRSHEDATELLSGKRLMELINRIHGQDPRRIILIDSSPLMQTTESRSLAAACGQVVMVVRAGITPKRAVLDAVAILESDKPTNLVLNQVRFGHSSGYHSSYYGGGYGGAYGGSDALKN